MSILLDNKILAAVEKGVEAGLAPETRENYFKIVNAGMRAGLDKGPEGLLAQLRNSKDPITDCAKGAVNLVLMMRREARGVMPVQAMIPAALTLMLQALDFADKARIVKVGKEEVDKATRFFTNYVFQSFNVTPEMMQKAGSRVRDVTRDPSQMETVYRRAGMVRDPRASTPTAMPQAPMNRRARRAALRAGRK